MTMRETIGRDQRSGSPDGDARGNTRGDGREAWSGWTTGARAGATHQMRGKATRRVAGALGWMSLAFGAAELVDPGRIARLSGIRDDGRTQTVLRLLALREIACGLGILLGDGSGWLWARVAGDAMDFALLGRSLAAETTQPGPIERASRWMRGESQPATHRSIAALATIFGVAALDVWCAVRLGRLPKARGRGLRRRGIEVHRAITVNHSAGELYALWRDLRNLLRFMRHIYSVEPLGDGRSRWVLKEPGGTTFEWEAEIVADRPNELIAWRSLPGASVANAGSVHFVPASRGRGTEIHVDLRYEPPLGRLGKVAAKLATIFGEAPAEQVADDLRRFKQVVETGEVARSDASIWGIALMQHPAQPPKQLPAELARR